MYCISGAAPLPPAAGERFRCLTGATVVEGYGLTEASPVTHANLRSRIRSGSIGVPMPDTQVRVMSIEDESREVGPNEPGELWISGPQVMRGYFRNSQETARVLLTDEEGTVWLRTGDIVEYDEEGFFRVIDRKKDMINRSGMKVYPSRVEKVLRMHNQVAEVAVVGRPDPVHTEAVVAVVVLASGAGDAGRLTEALKSLCRQHLAPYEVPTVFEFVEALPRSPLGKLLRRELRSGPAAPAPAGEPPTPAPRKEVA
jgi:long-chain acyl-CoA synthetase